MKPLEEQPRKLLNSMLLVQRSALDMNILSDTQMCYISHNATENITTKRNRALILARKLD